LVVEYRTPIDPAILGFPEASRGGSGIVNEGITDHSCNRSNPIADNTDVSELQSF
jgi:hypothetical protein